MRMLVKKMEEKRMIRKYLFTIFFVACYLNLFNIYTNSIFTKF